MQSGERERAGSSKLRIENKQEIDRFRRTKTPCELAMRADGLQRGRWSISRSEEVRDARGRDGRNGEVRPRVPWVVRVVRGWIGS
jgi:hypothetical protein